jgi:hypothetical protein
VFSIDPKVISISTFDGIFWIICALFALILFQRLLHREIQVIFLLISHRPGVTQVLFALVFFPGVLLHELSHFVCAKLLGVRTGKFSLIPQAMPDGKLRLGYVEMISGGFIRDSLIGVAPLVSGSLFVAYSAIYQLHLSPVWDYFTKMQWDAFWAFIISLPSVPDFWLWFYLTFTVSSTMLPSQSDQHAWLPLGLLILGLITVAIIAGAGTWMLTYLAPPFNQFLRALSTIFGLSCLFHAILFLPFSIFHWVLVKITKMDVG